MSADCFRNRFKLLEYSDECIFSLSYLPPLSVRLSSLVSFFSSESDAGHLQFSLRVLVGHAVTKLLLICLMIYRFSPLRIENADHGASQL